MLNIAKIVVGVLDTNCYIVWTEGLDALIIDPGADPAAISRIVGHCHMTIRAYLITHGHLDHISALASLWTRFQAPIAMPAPDLALGENNQMAPYFSAPCRPENIERVLKGGEEWDEAGFHYQVIPTPGHSPGSVCFYFPDDNMLFSGDTLFQGSVGRTDLLGGSTKQLQKSLQILAGLPPQTKVYPGHGPETTIGQEINFNPFLKIR